VRDRIDPERSLGHIDGPQLPPSNSAKSG